MDSVKPQPYPHGNMERSGHRIKFSRSLRKEPMKLIEMPQREEISDVQFFQVILPT
jgi:hypothetical protein